MTSWSICILAHNIERELPRLIASLDEAAAGRAFQAHLFDYGSSDQTARTARALAAADPRLRIHQRALPDRASAWNDYVHCAATEDAAMHVIMDGRTTPLPGSFPALSLALAGAPRAFAASGLPASGADRLARAAALYGEPSLCGELYAISALSLRRIRESALFLPMGALGEETILSYLFATDLVGGTYDGWRERIVIAPGAFFARHESGVSRRLASWRKARERASLRRFQHDLLFELLRSQGARAMPDDIRALYTEEAVAALRPRLAPAHFLFDCRALLEIDPAWR